MKLLVIILSLLNGVYMLIDGIYVMLNGKYIGPEKPGPWANLFDKLNVDVFKLGPLFILFGISWLVLVYSIWTSQHWAYYFGVILSVLTLWYFSVGTIVSVIVLVCLLVARAKIGI